MLRKRKRRGDRESCWEREGGVGIERKVSGEKCVYPGENGYISMS